MQNIPILILVIDGYSFDGNNLATFFSRILIKSHLLMYAEALKEISTCNSYQL